MNTEDTNAKVANIVADAVAVPPVKRAAPNRERFLIPARVKSYALQVSREKRAGKFKRVSEDFLISCESAVEAKVRALAPSYEVQSMPQSAAGLVNRAFLKRKLEEKIQDVAIAIIHGKVMSHPSIGQTLMR